MSPAGDTLCHIRSRRPTKRTKNTTIHKFLLLIFVPSHGFCKSVRDGLFDFDGGFELLEELLHLPCASPVANLAFQAFFFALCRNAFLQPAILTTEGHVLADVHKFVSFEQDEQEGY